MIYIFTDGGSIDNGKANCIASWAFCIVRRAGSSSSGGEKMEMLMQGKGLVDKVVITGKKYQTSNNRGELTGLLKGFEALERLAGDGVVDIAREPVCVVSDSQYSIKCLSVWLPSWILKGTVHLQLNTDLLLATKAIIARLGVAVEYMHVRSHKKEPEKTSGAWFYWKYNDVVDADCGAVLAEMRGVRLVKKVINKKAVAKK